jgi:hypothetical protein
MRMHQEEEAIWRRLNDPAGLARSLGNQALILRATGDLEGGMRLHEGEEAIWRRLNDPNGLAISLVNQARCWPLDSPDRWTACRSPRKPLASPRSMTSRHSSIKSSRL